MYTNLPLGGGKSTTLQLSNCHVYLDLAFDCECSGSKSVSEPGGAQTSGLFLSVILGWWMAADVVPHRAEHRVAFAGAAHVPAGRRMFKGAGRIFTRWLLVEERNRVELHNHLHPFLMYGACRS